MLRADNLSKWYGANLILTDVSFIVNPAERVGLVGINGSGKTTLLRILAGLEHPDTGTVFLSPGETIGYLPQTMESFAEETLRRLLDSAQPELPVVRQRMQALEELIAQTSADPGDLPGLLQEYDESRAQFEALGGYTLENRMERILEGLELDGVELDGKLGLLSGGQKIKVALARLLVANPSILLLDEPTNNLDLPALLWLERYLAHYAGAIIVVSHDRKFLDRTVDQVIELDDTQRTTTSYPGNFSAYSRQKQVQLAKWAEAYKDQQEWIGKMTADIRRTRQQAQVTESATRDSKFRRYAKKVAKKAKSREKRLTKALEGQDRVEQPPQEWGLKLDLTGSIPAGMSVLHAQGIHWWYGERHLLNGVSLDIKGGDRAVIVGRNGAGKSTLLKVLVGELTPPAGLVSLGAETRLGYFAQEHTGLMPGRAVLEEFRRAVAMYEDEARQFLSYFLFFEDEVYKRVEELSLGERAKLVLAKLVVSGANFLVLDEPTNHMDYRSLEVMEAALAQFQGSLLMVSHDRYLIDAIGVNKVLSLEDGRLIRQVGGYAEYEARFGK